MMEGRNLPVFWGNSEWEQLSDGTIIKGEKIDHHDKRRIDYSTFDQETVHISAGNTVASDLRKKLQEQIIRKNLQDNEKAINISSPKFVMISGGTASGKSSMAEELLKEIKSSYIEINHDKIKKEIPEYEELIACENKKAAELVQHESVKMTGKLLKKAIQKQYNIVYEFNFAKSKIVSERMREIRKKGYVALLFYTFVDLDTAIRRQRIRAQQTGRYVNENYIKDSYRVIPKNIKDHKELFDFVIASDNRGNKLIPFYLYRSKSRASDPIVNPKVYQEYLKIVGRDNALI